MRLIDILILKAHRKLKDGMKFIYDDMVWIYVGDGDRIKNSREKRCIGYYYNLENHLMDEVIVL